MSAVFLHEGSQFWQNVTNESYEDMRSNDFKGLTHDQKAGVYKWLIHNQNKAYLSIGTPSKVCEKWDSEIFHFKTVANYNYMDKD